MRMTIPGHLVKRVQNQDDRELASGLTERQADCRHLSGPDKDLSHVVIDAMDEYKNIDQHQVDKVFEQVADVIRRQQAFRSVARSDAALPHGGHKSML
jgi:hypothetical protein